MSCFFCNFATMNTDYFYPLLLCFASGVTLCLLIGCCIFLFRRHHTYQFQRTFAVVMLMLAVGFFNNFLMLACRNLPIALYINTLLILYDYIIVGGFMMFVVSLVFPSRYSALQLLLFEVPYVVALLMFAFTRIPLIYNAVQIYTIVTSTALWIWLSSAIRKHNRMLLDNTGNLEYFDLHWGAILITLLYAVQLVWAVESLSNQSWFTVDTADSNLLFDTLWCFISMAYVLLILRKIVRQQVFSIPAQDAASADTSASTTEYYKALDNINIDSAIRDKRLYLDTAMTLQKLATLLGTNRQYLSNYINREKQRTFYEYINDFRLEEARNILDHWKPAQQRSMEDVATLSGFNSYSTFLRSFVKKYGVSPSKYLKSISPQP